MASESKFENALYLFNRDLRIDDNMLLRQSTHDASRVYPIFVFTPEQVTRNSYKNSRAIGFMARSLAELARDMPISFFYGKVDKVIASIIKQHDIGAVYNNLDVTPYAIARSRAIEAVCRRADIPFISGNDVFMGRCCELTKKDGSPYLKFTPFYNNAIGLLADEKSVGRPRMDKFARLPNSDGELMLRKLIAEHDVSGSPFIPGRSAAVSAIRRFARSKVSYAETRDLPAKNATSHLSAYLHYGVIGPNEIIKHLAGQKNAADITRQLLWREFYLYIVWKHHTDYRKASLTLPRNNKIRWVDDPAGFRRWISGRTGCPIVDAGMRELIATGYMQNRVRMIVAMFLIYYLKIDWRLGEMHFARHLVDYDYCNNVGGWMWCAGWEVYGNDWFRPFSMAAQTERFDPDGEYIRRWVPEVRDVDARDLYDWSENHKKYPTVDYPPMISDLSEARARGIEMYKKAHA